MSLGKEMKVCATSCSLLLGLFMSASTLAMAQSEPAHRHRPRVRE